MRTLTALLFLVVSLLAVSCSGDGGDPELEAVPDEATPTETATATTTPAVSVPILSSTAVDLFDRPDLSPTVSDVVDRPRALVPDVVDLEVDEARAELEDAGFVPYLIDTFPPFGGPVVVLDSFPFAGESHFVGEHVFLEVEGPLDAVLARSGDQVTGVLNGMQDPMITDTGTWFITIWLDEPLAVQLTDGVGTPGREFAARVVPSDLECSDGQPVDDPSTLAPGSPVSAVIEYGTLDEIAAVAPFSLPAPEVIVDCEGAG